MRSVTHGTTLTLLMIIFSHLSAMEKQSIVLACNFGALSKNADTGNIISQALTTARQILSCFYWRSIAPWNLYATISHMQKRGGELAATTPGITNTIRALFSELEQQQYGKFTDTAINYFNEMGINPVVDHEAVSALQSIKSFEVPIIGVGSQDSLEHAIYSRKMLDEHSIDLKKLFDGTVTIPTLEEQERLDCEHKDFLVRDSENTRWLLARHPAPSCSMDNAVRILAQNFVGHPAIWSVNTKEQLSIAAKTIVKVFQQRDPSPESSRLFGELIEQFPIALSPTRV